MTTTGLPPDAIPSAVQMKWHSSELLSGQIVCIICYNVFIRSEFNLISAKKVKYLTGSLVIGT